MKYWHLLALALACVTGGSAMAAESVHEFKMKDIDGKVVALSDYKGKVLLIVNVASECGLTPQYEQLQALHDKYHEKGLVVVGIPCNQFGGQEPGTEKDIKKFCSDNYKVSFPMMSKVNVNGDKQDPLYTYLKKQEPAHDYLKSEPRPWITHHKSQRNWFRTDCKWPNVRLTPSQRRRLLAQHKTPVTLSHGRCSVCT